MAEKNDKNMLADFLTAVLGFAWKMIRWALWALFRITELVSGAIAKYLQASLTEKA